MPPQPKYIILAFGIWFIFGFLKEMTKEAWKDLGWPQIHRINGYWIKVWRKDGIWRARRIR